MLVWLFKLCAIDILAFVVFDAVRRAGTSYGILYALGNILNSGLFMLVSFAYAV
jgi:hypothetical protein